MILEHKGIPIFFEDHGKGPAIVLLHGFLENSTMWKEITPALLPSNRVIVIDLLGHGKSGCLGYVHSMELMADAVEAVLKSLRISRITLVGHSMGGYVALALAEKHPQKVKGLCLLNSTAQADTEERKEIRNRAFKMAQTNYHGIITMSIANLFHPKNLQRFSKEVSTIKKEALQTTLHGYLAAQKGMKLRPNREAVIKEGSFKTLYLFGEEDPILEMNSILEESKRLNTQAVALKGGHMSHVENKDKMILVLKQFLQNKHQL